MLIEYPEIFHNHENGHEYFNVEVPTPNLMRRGIFSTFIQHEFYDQKSLRNITSHLEILKFIWILALLRDLPF